MDCNVDDTVADDGSVSLFVPEDEYAGIDVPEPVLQQVVSPRSKLFGESEEVLDNTIFTRIKMEASDFTVRPRKLPSLLFANTDIVRNMPSATAGLSPLFIVLGGHLENVYFIGETSRCRSMVKSLFNDNMLLLPVYLTSGRDLKFQGTEVAFRNLYGGGIGKLWARSFICQDIILFGQSFFTREHFSYPKDCSLYSIWRNWSIIEELRDNMVRGMMNYDIDQFSIPEYKKYSGGDN